MDVRCMLINGDVVEGESQGPGWSSQGGNTLVVTWYKGREIRDGNPSPGDRITIDQCVWHQVL